MGSMRPPAPAEDTRQRVLDAALKRTGFRQDALIEVLHAAQNSFGYLTPELLWYVASRLRLPPSRVYGVATFYNFFSQQGSFPERYAQPRQAADGDVGDPPRHAETVTART